MSTPKMAEIAKLFEPIRGMVATFEMKVFDDVGSIIYLIGSYGPGSRFAFEIMPPNGARFYAGGKVSARMAKCCDRPLPFRKFTSEPYRVAEAVAQWIEAARPASEETVVR
jgi:hypothetical protein